MFRGEDKFEVSRIGDEVEVKVPGEDMFEASKVPDEMSVLFNGIK